MATATPAVDGQARLVVKGLFRNTQTIARRGSDASRAQAGPRADALPATLQLREADWLRLLTATAVRKNGEAVRCRC